ncbi:MAG: ferrous iron transporter B, partial [Lachnospiraceae bacterium]|nr:ferrous iron transporter B [Lachnospiraceae bacterium]
MRIALTGNPNSGKTTMYNALTGRNEKIGNWAGVTVDRKESRIRDKFNDSGKELIAVDLPGAYSMSPFTSEESITSSYVKNEHPDAIINIVDATNLSRSLFFTTQLLELGIPVVVALNKSDVNEKKGNKINEVLLAEKLGCPVIDTVSTSEKGIKEAVSLAASLEGKGQKSPYHQGDIDLSSKEAVEAADRKRFDFVNGVVKDVEVRKTLTKDKNKGDAIDKVVTNPIIGILIFAAIMFVVFYISQTTVGTWLADILVGWIETFQEWAGEQLGDANPLLYALLIDGIIGGVGAVV